MAAALFGVSLVLSIKRDLKWMKFFSFGLGTLAFLGTLLPSSGILTYDEIVNLKLAVVLFVVFAFVFYISYRMSDNI